MKLLALALGATLLMTAAPVMAAPQTFEFDKKHTQIFFEVSHLGFSHSTGRFLDFDGHFTFDAANPKAGGSADVTIQTSSITMGDEAWDNHLKNEDFFNVTKFPTMTFKSTRVEVDSDGDEADLYGDLTILGVTKPVKLDVDLNKCGDHPMSGVLTCGFSAETEIKRSEWGMTYGLPGVGDKVKIRIEVEANAAAQP